MFDDFLVITHNHAYFQLDPQGHYFTTSFLSFGPYSAASQRNNPRSGPLCTILAAYWSLSGPPGRPAPHLPFFFLLWCITMHRMLLVPRRCPLIVHSTARSILPPYMLYIKYTFRSCLPLIYPTYHPPFLSLLHILSFHLTSAPSSITLFATSRCHDIRPRLDFDFTDDAGNVISSIRQISYSQYDCLGVLIVVLCCSAMYSTVLYST